jgi:hypothetical protein
MEKLAKGIFLLILIWYLVGWLLVLIAYEMHASQVVLTVLIAWAIIPW